MNGKLITFEGIDGSGKTTQIKHLAKFLESKQLTVYVTREPGGTELAEKIRSLLLDPKQKVTSMTELLMIFAARADHIEKIIKPKILAGQWVICSRFTDATFAYQGFARRVDLELIEQLATMVHQDLNPDQSFILDISAEKAAIRREKRGEFVDRFELEKISFMQDVRKGYQEIAAQNIDRCHLIDANEDSQKIALNIQQIISKRYFL